MSQLSVDVIIHPGWTKEGIRNRNSLYYNRIDSSVADITFIYLPTISQEYVNKHIIKQLDDIVNMYLGKKYAPGLDLIIKKEALILYMDYVKKQTDTRNKKITINKITGTYSATKLKGISLIRKILEISLKDISYNNYFVTSIFVGSKMVYNENRLFFKEIMDRYKDNEVVYFLEIGNLLHINHVGKVIYKKLEDKHPLNINLYGEYLEECVQSHKLMLEKENFNHIILEENCVSV